MRGFGLDYAALSQRSPRADLRVDLRLRPDRTVGVEGRLRSRRAGRLGTDVDHRRSRAAAGESRRAADRSRRRRCSRCRRFSRRCTTARAPGAGSTSTRRWSRRASRCRCGKRPSTSSGGGIPQPMGSAHRMSAPYQAIRCADGYITLAAANDRLFARLCDAARPSGVGERSRLRRRYRARTQPCDAGRADRERSRSKQPRGALAATSRGERHAVRADQRLRAGVRRSADRARGTWWSRPITRRSAACARSARRSRCRRRRRSSGRRAPLLGEHTGRCCARPDSPTTRSREWRAGPEAGPALGGRIIRRPGVSGVETPGVLQGTAKHELDLAVEAAQVVVAQRWSASRTARSMRSRNGFRSATNH